VTLRRLLLVFALAGCASTGPTYIVPAERPLSGTAPAWTPAPADTARAERGLRGYLRSLGAQVHDYGNGPLWRRLRGYGRQYVGVMRNGHRVIWINLFATDTAFYEKGSEQQTLVKLHECGDCNAEVYFDIDRGTYYDFWESTPLIK
jgi:predicted small lipoprotein YifL